MINYTSRAHDFREMIPIEGSNWFYIDHYSKQPSFRLPLIKSLSSSDFVSSEFINCLNGKVRDLPVEKLNRQYEYKLPSHVNLKGASYPLREETRVAGVFRLVLSAPMLDIVNQRIEDTIKSIESLTIDVNRISCMGFETLVFPEDIIRDVKDQEAKEYMQRYNEYEIEYRHQFVLKELNKYPDYWLLFTDVSLGKYELEDINEDIEGIIYKGL